MPILFDGMLLADYHQIYLEDAAISASLPAIWRDGDVEARILVGKHSVTFATARNLSVPVRVELHDVKPEIDARTADHIVVGNFLTLGKIVIAGLLDYIPEAKHADVPAGNLCAMAVSTGLGTLSEDGIQGDDRYSIHLWPCEQKGVTVLRQWQNK
ncbi:hypothetical protein V9K92_00900 [Phyllobacterium sp. CCNWLW109]|uniref:hypothetical protein n=1 Tax=Phyllobacterium sp. CCNWLW109 TaxID=3127479 RepID=UPI0030775BDD